MLHKCGVIGVFWDGENVRIPKAYDAGRVSNDIRTAVSSHGRIIEKSFYYDARKDSEVKTDRIHIDLAGFKVVDCPTRGLKETIDKKIIVDVMSFVFSHLQHDVPCSVVLISGDGDYAYMLSRLRDVGVKTIVIFPEHRTLPIQLFNAAEIKLSWKGDVLNLPTVQHESMQRTTNDLTGRNPAGVFGRHAIPRSQCSHSRFVVPSTSFDIASGSEDEVLFGNGSGSVSEQDSCCQMTEGRGDVFLECVRRVQSAVAEANRLPFDTAWAMDTVIAQEWYRNYGKDKTRYTAHRNTALWAHYVARKPLAKQLELRLTAHGLHRVDPGSEIAIADSATVAHAFWTLADSQGGSFCTIELGRIYSEHPEYKAVIDAHGGPKKFCGSTPSLAFLVSCGSSCIQRLTPSSCS